MLCPFLVFKPVCVHSTQDYISWGELARVLKALLSPSPFSPSCSPPSGLSSPFPFEEDLTPCFLRSSDVVNTSALYFSGNFSISCIDKMISLSQSWACIFAFISDQCDQNSTSVFVHWKKPVLWFNDIPCYFSTSCVKVKAFRVMGSLCGTRCVPVVLGQGAPQFADVFTSTAPQLSAAGNAQSTEARTVHRSSRACTSGPSQEEQADLCSTSAASTWSISCVPWTLRLICLLL